MKSKKIKTKVSISRDSNDMVNIRIKDSASINEFVVVSLTLEDFALVITGLGNVECSSTVQGLENVGKTKVSESRAIKQPTSIDRNKMEEWIDENCQEEGWIVNSSLRSQGSVRGDFLHYSVSKYVEEN